MKMQFKITYHVANREWSDISEREVEVETWEELGELCRDMEAFDAGDSTYNIVSIEKL